MDVEPNPLRPNAVTRRGAIATGVAGATGLLAGGDLLIGAPPAAASAKAMAS